MVAIPREQDFIKAIDGTKLYYEVTGIPGKPTLFFCYGLACSRLQWKYQIEYLERHYSVVYMDYRAHNRSDTPDDIETMNIRQFAADIRLAMDELNIEKASFLGHSLGVNILLEFFRHYPSRVDALLLTCGTPRNPFTTMFHHNIAVLGHQLSQYLTEHFPDLMQKIWQEQGNNRFNYEFISFVGFNRKYATREDIEEYMRLTGAISWEYMLYLTNDFSRFDACHWLEDIDVPSMIIGGEKDLITPIETQKLLHQLIPNSQLLAIKKGSHCVQMEQKLLVNESIYSFLETIYQ